MLVFSCQEVLIEQEYENNPEDVFEALWSEFDQLYALFEVKQIHWDSLYAIYRPQVNTLTTNPALYDIICGLLSQLNDNHILLYAEGMEVFRAGTLDRLPAYASAPYTTFESDVNRYFYVLRNRYLEDGFQSLSGDIPSIYGWISGALSGAANLGYLHPGNSRSKDIDLVQAAFDALSQTDGLVIDLRFSTGSNELLALEVAGHCTAEKHMFMTSQTRIGPDHDDFDEPVERTLRPLKPYYPNPIVVLTNRHTMDAAEELLLAMKSLSQVIVMGDTTAGAFSAVLTRDLPNGWRYTLPKSLVRDGDGICYEGAGLIPDQIVKNDRNELLNQIDTPLLTAIQVLK